MSLANWEEELEFPYFTLIKSKKVKCKIQTFQPDPTKPGYFKYITIRPGSVYGNERTPYFRFAVGQNEYRGKVPDGYSRSDEQKYKGLVKKFLEAEQQAEERKLINPPWLYYIHVGKKKTQQVCCIVDYPSNHKGYFLVEVYGESGPRRVRNVYHIQDTISFKKGLKLQATYNHRQHQWYEWEIMEQREDDGELQQELDPEHEEEVSEEEDDEELLSLEEGGSSLDCNPGPSQEASAGSNKEKHKTHKRKGNREHEEDKDATPLGLSGTIGGRHISGCVFTAAMDKWKQWRKIKGHTRNKQGKYQAASNAQHCSFLTWLSKNFPVEGVICSCQKYFTKANAVDVHIRRKPKHTLYAVTSTSDC